MFLQAWAKMLPKKRFSLYFIKEESSHVWVKQVYSHLQYIGQLLKAQSSQ